MALHRRALILDVPDIDTCYGLGHILHRLSLRVGEGEVVALLGRNSAGKTTTLRFEGTPAALRADEQITATYLGGGR